MGHFDGCPCQQLSFFFSPRQVLDDFLSSSGLWGGFWMIFRSTFGCSELLFFTILWFFTVGFVQLFQKAIVVVALCTSHTHLRYFASQLIVSICYSSYMDYMSCQHVCLHGYAALSRGSPCMTNHQRLYDVSNFSIVFFMTMFTEFPQNKSKKSREVRAYFW